MELEDWLENTGREALAALAEDMPGSSHGKRKPELIRWILSDPEARDRAEMSRMLSAVNPNSPNAPLGFVNRAGDAL